MKALVSGIAGDIGFGVGRILKNWSIFTELHGIDISDDHPGELLFDHCQKAPRANEHSYIPWVSNYLRKHGIDLFIPTSEAEISTISQSQVERLFSGKLLINSPHIIEKALDKHSTLQFLESCGIQVPTHGVIGLNKPTSFPVILKPRRGQGSKGIRIATSEKDCLDYKEDYIWQEMLLPEDQEFTCAVYVSPSKELRTLLIKRRLIGGFTAKGEIVCDQEIDDYVRGIAMAFNFNGCINIQLRRTLSGPLVFEINPRISSTLVFRDLLGFQDLRWWISDLLNIPQPQYSHPSFGTKFYRGNSEYIIHPNTKK